MILISTLSVRESRFHYYITGGNNRPHRYLLKNLLIWHMLTFGRAKQIVRDASYAEYESDRAKYFDDRIPDALEGEHVETRDTNPLTFNAANDRRNQQRTDGRSGGTRSSRSPRQVKTPTKSASDLFDGVLADLYAKETRNTPETDGFDDIASIMGFEPTLQSPLEKEHSYWVST